MYCTYRQHVERLLGIFSELRITGNFVCFSVLSKTYFLLYNEHVLLSKPAESRKWLYFKSAFPIVIRSHLETHTWPLIPPFHLSYLRASKVGHKEQESRRREPTAISCSTMVLPGDLGCVTALLRASVSLYLKYTTWTGSVLRMQAGHRHTNAKLQTHP